MLVKSARAIELHWTTEPLVWAAGEAIEVPDSLVPMLLPLGGFTVVGLEPAPEPEEEPTPAPRAKKKKE